MSKIHGMEEAKMSVLVSDCCQGMGIGSKLVKSLVDVARQEKLDKLTATMTPDNEAMRNIFQRLDFDLQRISRDGREMVEAELKFDEMEKV